MGVAGNLGLDLSGYTVKSVGIVDCNSVIGFEQLIPLLKEEEWLRHKEKGPLPKWRRRGGQDQ